EEEVGKGGDGAGGEFTQCKKVYHAYCMGFNIASNELGSCPRHACLDCGEAAIFYCRFCPLSLCNEHYATDPSDVIGNTQAALEHRARHPFPRSRIGAPIGGWRKKARGRSRASYKTPPLNRSVKSRGGRSTTPPPGGPPSETIAARRPKRSVAATATPASVVDAARVKKMRLDSAEKSKVVELMAEGRRVRAGWFARREFVCRGCKMATKRAVRQYGLLGSLETDGIVLPFGESEGSDDESESEIYPITPGLPSASKANPDHNPNPGHDRRCSDSSNGSRCNGGGGGGGVTSGGVGVAPGCYRGPAPRAAPVAGIAAAAAAAANNAVAALAAEKYFSMFSRRDP
ncbi:unnamed protein product, partial [Laminaria digitata]